MVWLTGWHDGGDQPIVLDGEVTGGFSLPAWLAEVHDGYPDAVAAVVHGGDASLAVLVAERLLGSSDTRFRGDTTPSSLGDLRAWVRTVARDPAIGGPRMDAETVERLVLVTSELAANVEHHAPGWLLVDLAALADEVLVAVTDSRPAALPERREGGAGPAWRGGLDVVRAVSGFFGLLSGPTTKTVWATVACPTRRAGPGTRRRR